MRSFFVGALLIAGCLQAATECVWVGGAEGNFNNQQNWSDGTVPTGIDKDYVAVFTNSVDLTLDTSWYAVGTVVSNNAIVVATKTSESCRFYPSRLCADGKMLIDIEAGSSLTINAFFFSLDGRSLVKKGGGLLAPKSWFGNLNSSGAYWTSIDVQDGILKLPADSRTCITSTLHICSGATVMASDNNPFVAREMDATHNYRFSQPKVEIEGGGTFDMNGKSVSIASLEGAGNVINCVKNLNLLLRDSGCVFSGRIDGGGSLSIMPTNTWTAAGATWIVGAADTLRGVELNRNEGIGCSYEVKFASGIETFYARVVPADMPSFNTDGAPVEIVRAGDFWYVDCKRKGEAGDGKSFATAFQTLKEAMENPDLSAGDTVWVAPGVYSNDTMLAGTISHNRAIVPANVRLVSLEGPEVTVIAGEDSPNPVAGCYGCGPEAVRCVRLGAGSTLRGFTLRGGRSCANGKDEQGDSYIGGGVFAADASSVIIDCVISNCVACRGGGVNRGTYFNCRFFANRATTSQVVGAHLVGYANLYNCVLRGALSGCDWYVNNTGVKVVNCTFDYNSNGGLRGLKADENERTGIFNSLILAKPLNNLPGEYANCIISPKGELPDDDNSIVTNLTIATKPTVYEFAGIDPVTLKPKKYSSRVVGAADAEEYLSHFPVKQYWLSQYDADFKPRISKGKVDIGAYALDRTMPFPSFKITIR